MTRLPPPDLDDAEAWVRRHPGDLALEGRLVLLSETLADLAQRRDVEVHRGAVPDVLAGRRLAATWAPVPGFRARSARFDVVALHPWLRLRRPAGGSACSFTSWAERHGGSPASASGGAPRRRRSAG